MKGAYLARLKQRAREEAPIVVTYLTVYVYAAYRLNDLFVSLTLLPQQDSVLYNLLIHHGYMPYLALLTIVSMALLGTLGTLKGSRLIVYSGVLLGYVVGIVATFLISYPQRPHGIVDAYSLELVFLTIFLFLTHNLRPLIKSRAILKVEGRLLYRVIDTLGYAGSLMIFALLLTYVLNLFKSVIKGVITVLPEELEGILLKYLETGLGTLIISLLSFSIVVYFAYNLVEPIVIYLTSGRAQAYGVLLHEYEMLVLRERSFLRRRVKMFDAGLIALVVIAFTSTILSFLKYPPSRIVAYVLNTLMYLIGFPADIALTDVDVLLSQLSAKYVEVLKERVEEFIRVILKLLY